MDEHSSDEEPHRSDDFEPKQSASPNGGTARPPNFQPIPTSTRRQQQSLLVRHKIRYVHFFISSLLPTPRKRSGQRRELQGPSLGGIAATGSDMRPRGGREQRSTQHGAGRTSRYVVVVVRVVVVVVVVGVARSSCSPWHLLPGREGGI